MHIRPRFQNGFKYLSLRNPALFADRAPAQRLMRSLSFCHSKPQLPAGDIGFLSGGHSRPDRRAQFLRARLASQSFGRSWKSDMVLAISTRLPRAPEQGACEDARSALRCGFLSDGCFFYDGNVFPTEYKGDALKPAAIRDEGWCTPYAGPPRKAANR